MKTLPLWFLSLAFVFGGCIDTELSLAVTVLDAELSAGASEADLAVELEIRVGTFALEGDRFSVPRASLFDGETPVAEFSLQAPEDFQNELEPGESVDVTMTASASLSALGVERDALCNLSEPRIVVSYIAEQNPADPLDPPIRSAGSETGPVTVQCP